MIIQHLGLGMLNSAFKFSYNCPWQGTDLQAILTISKKGAPYNIRQRNKIGTTEWVGGLCDRRVHVCTCTSAHKSLNWDLQPFVPSWACSTRKEETHCMGYTQHICSLYDYNLTKNSVFNSSFWNQNCTAFICHETGDSSLKMRQGKHSMISFMTSPEYSSLKHSRLQMGLTSILSVIKKGT